MSIFKKIGHFFVGLFDAAKKAYLNLDPAQQDALQHGTGLVNLINLMTQNSANEIRAAIQKQFPNISEVALEQGLFQVAQTFGFTGASNIDETIDFIKSKLASLQGKGWATASHAAASILSVLFAPAETKVSVIVSLIEFVYQHFIKKAA